MRGINAIQNLIDGERENRDYLQGRIDHWEAKLNDVEPGTTDHAFIVRRLTSLEAQLREAKSELRLLKIEMDDALPAA